MQEQSRKLRHATAPGITRRRSTLARSSSVRSWADPVFADFAGRMRSTGIVQKLLGFLLVGPRHVEGVFQGCLVLEGRVVFHEHSVVPFPG